MQMLWKKAVRLGVAGVTAVAALMVGTPVVAQKVTLDVLYAQPGFAK